MPSTPIEDECLVEDADVAVVEPAPDHRDRGGHRDHRQEVEGAVDAGAAQALEVEQHRQQHRQRDPQEYEPGVDAGVAQRLPELGIVHERAVVGQADPGRPAEGAPLREAVVHRLHHGPQVEDREAQPGRGDQRVSPPLVPVLEAARPAAQFPLVHGGRMAALSWYGGFRTHIEAHQDRPFLSCASRRFIAVVREPVTSLSFSSPLHAWASHICSLCCHAGLLAELGNGTA